MSEEANTANGSYHSLLVYPPMRWKVHLSGKHLSSSYGVIWTTPLDFNWFHRFMTRLCFGWYWERL